MKIYYLFVFNDLKADLETDDLTNRLMYVILLTYSRSSDVEHRKEAAVMAGERPMYSIERLAALLGVSYATVLRMVKAGRVERHVLGKRLVRYRLVQDASTPPKS